MPQKRIEIILARQFASYLSTPIFIVDPEGGLLFYNEPAEAILGVRFEETGEMGASEWSRIFIPIDEYGNPLPPDTLPLIVALHDKRPAHRRFWIKGLDNVQRFIEVVAFPLQTHGGRTLGAIAVFNEVKGE